MTNPKRAEELADWMLLAPGAGLVKANLHEAAAELRRLSAVEAELDSMNFNFNGMLEDRNAWKARARSAEAERDRLAAELERVKQAEPVAWLVRARNGMTRAVWTVNPDEEQLYVATLDGDTVTPLYASAKPAARGREPLTDEQAMRAVINACDSPNTTRVHELGGKTRTICDEAGLLEIARAIEAAHGITSSKEGQHG